MRMNTLTACGLAAFFAVLCAGCAGTEVQEARPRVFEATGVAFLEEPGRKLVEAPAECVRVVEASGEGLPAANAVNAIELRLTAVEAAKYRAMANLAEKMEGAEVVKVARSSDLRFQSEEIEAMVSANLEWVRITEQRYDEQTGIAKVTVQIGLDAQGNVTAEMKVPIEPLSLAERRARAEAAARIHAVAKLREQIGEVRVYQKVKVKDLVLQSQKAWLIVEGIVKGAQFSRPSWPTHQKCEVTARLEVLEEEFQRFTALTPPAR